MTIIIDENLPRRWKEYLASFDISAKHWIEIGNVGDADQLLFDYARQHRSIIITQDLDFGRMLALYQTSLPSVITLRVEAPIPEVIGEMVLQVLEGYPEQLQRGCLITIDAKRNRFRLLPIN